MALGDDAYDQLAHALSETDFDAIEHEGLRAEWIDDGAAVRVTDLTGETDVIYNAEDLVRATSDRELKDARDPGSP